MMNPVHPPEQLSRDLARAGLDVRWFGACEENDLPVASGAYALLLSLAHAMTLDRPRTAGGPLAPGWYVYAGSACGPGGIRARLARHFRPDKRAHWHIDQLTGSTRVRVWASVLPDLHECDLVANLEATGNFHAACAGFGSSDCRQCAAHLLRWRARHVL